MSPLFSQAEFDRANRSLHLQSLGRVPAVPASELIVGDRTIWNYGSIYEVMSVERLPSGKTIRTVLRDEATGTCYDRRFALDRMVGVVPPGQSG